MSANGWCSIENGNSVREYSHPTNRQARGNTNCGAMRATRYREPAARPHSKCRDHMEQHAHHAAYQRAVDPDVLQVAADLGFDAATDLLRAPAFHHRRDQRR